MDEDEIRDVEEVRERYVSCIRMSYLWLMVMLKHT